jgi:hypothetical protein
VNTELSRIVSIIPYEILSELFDKLAPQLFMMLKEGMEEVKREGSLLLITLIYYISSSTKRKSAIEQILTDFAKSPSSAHRKTYIDFCVKAMQVTSQSFFKANFLPALMELANDKSSLVRNRFVKRAIPALNEYLGVSNTPFVIELIGLVDRLKSDQDREVSESAYDVDENTKFYKFPNKDKQKEFETRENDLKKLESTL